MSVTAAAVSQLANTDPASPAPPEGTLTGPAESLYLIQVLLHDWADPPEPDPAGYFRVWSGRPDGTLRPLGGQPREPRETDFPTPVAPTVSPDGAWLVFGTHSRNGRRIVARRINRARDRPAGHTRTLIRVAPDASPPLVTWSPDSRQLALAGAVRGHEGLWLLRRDGSRLRRIRLPSSLVVESDIDEYNVPAWSSTGRLAFVAHRGRNSSAADREIYTVGLDGHGLRRVTTGRHEPTAPAWSPDGHRLAYVRDFFNFAGSLRVLDMLGGRERILDSEDGGPAAWSPDGTRIAYQGYVRRADGSGPRRKLSFSNDDIEFGYMFRFDWVAR